MQGKLILKNGTKLHYEQQGKRYSITNINNGKHKMVTKTQLTRLFKLHIDNAWRDFFMEQVGNPNPPKKDRIAIRAKYRLDYKENK